MRGVVVARAALGGALVLLVALVVLLVHPSGFGLPGGTSVPAEYRRVIVAATRACDGVSAPVLAAQIEAESGWNPGAVSSKGAQGIAQFMPETWDRYGMDAPRPFSGDGKADVWNPHDAIYSAARYNCTLRRMLERVPGDPTRNVLAAYNSGPYAVLAHAGVPPFDETRAYVAGILETAEELAVSELPGRAG